MASHEEGGDATADNAAVADGAEGTHAHAGDDTISGSFGDDTVAGDALAAGDGSEALANNTATASGSSTATTGRSEEHTSELQALMRISYAVSCLQKNKYTISIT